MNNDQGPWRDTLREMHKEIKAYRLGEGCTDELVQFHDEVLDALWVYKEKKGGPAGNGTGPMILRALRAHYDGDTYAVAHAMQRTHHGSGGYDTLSEAGAFNATYESILGRHPGIAEAARRSKPRGRGRRRSL